MRIIGSVLKEKDILENICNVNHLRLFNVFMSTLVFIFIMKIFLITNVKSLTNTYVKLNVLIFICMKFKNLNLNYV
jgi:hypothetical protein